MFRSYGYLAVVLTAAVSIQFSGCASPGGSARLTDQQRQLHVESFDVAWTVIRDRHFDPELNGLDWDAVREELKPKVQRADSIDQARRVIYEMFDRLECSHYGLIPEEVLDRSDEPEDEEAKITGNAGFDVRIIDGRALVTSVVEGSAAYELGVKPGWEVVRIDEQDMVSLLEKRTRRIEESSHKRMHLTLPYVVRLRGPVGDLVTVEFLDGQDESVEVEIPLAVVRGEVVRLGDIRDINVWFEKRLLDGNIGYIAFNGFIHPVYVMKEYNDAISSFMECDGIVIDVRGNGGGMLEMVSGMIGWLVDEEYKQLGTIYMRDNELKIVVLPRPNTYKGPVVVLTDELSGSGAEAFPGLLQSVGRACVIGTRTQGSVLGAQFERLPNGDILLYAAIDFVTADGTRLEGVGVEPDIEVVPTREQLLAGEDPVMEAAVEWIKKQR